MRILILGARGFIGRNLADELSVRGHSVEGIVRPCDEWQEPLTNREGERVLIREIQADLSQPGWSASLKPREYDWIVHAAGISTVQHSDVQAGLDLQLAAGVTLEAIDLIHQNRSSAKLLLISSAAVYGNATQLPISEVAPRNPISAYGLSRKAAEDYFTLAMQKGRIHGVIARPFSIYGPGLKRLVVHDLIRRLTDHPNSIRIIGDGQQQRDLIHIKDAVTALRLLIETDRQISGAYNIASGQSTAIINLLHTIAATLGASPEITHAPARPDDPVHFHADISRISQLGFASEFDLAAGIKETIAADKHTELQAT
jgi:nucleoside-diphosphate-sugar epimerase